MHPSSPNHDLGTDARAATTWLGHRLLWERRLDELRAAASGTTRLTPRRRPEATPERRVA